VAQLGIQVLTLMVAPYRVWNAAQVVPQAQHHGAWILMGFALVAADFQAEV